MWSVVVFEKDNSVEAVPSCWYINGRCFWPKNSKHCKKLLERKSIPNTIEYDLFTARRLSLNINSLTVARQKASKAQISSDLSSADDDIQTRKERKRKQSSSLSPELPKKKPSHTITSPPLWDSSDSNCEIVNNSQLDENKGHIKSNSDITTPITKKPMINRNLFDCFSEPANTKKKIALNSDDDAGDITDIDYTNCKDIFEDQHDYGSSSIYISSNSEPPQKLASFSQSNGSKVEKKSTSYKNSINNISATPSTSNINNTIERDDSNSYNYAKQTLRIATNLKYDIKRLHDGQDYLKMMVDKIFSQLNNQTSSSSDSHSLHHYDVPHITNENDLNEWEDTIIKDSSYLSTIAQQLSLMGGQSISETVRKLMQRLFSDTFLVDYSFIGFKGKKTFSSLRSCDLIKLAVRKVPIFQNASDIEIEKPLKSFMAQASARLKLKSMKTKVIPTTYSQNTAAEENL